MDDNFGAILDSLPKKRQRSKLEPYTELTYQLRRRGHTYREIARILAEKCDLDTGSLSNGKFQGKIGCLKKIFKNRTYDTLSFSICGRLCGTGLRESEQK